MEFYSNREEVQRRAEAVTLLLLDVDGVMTPGEIIYGSDGQELKQFHIQDGLGIKLLQRNRIEVAILSGRQSTMLTRRANELGIDRVVQGRDDKGEALEQLCRESDLAPQRIAYAGDDLPDIAVFQRVGLALTVSGAHDAVHPHVHACTERGGGRGAVREIADFLLRAQHRYDQAIAPWLQS